MILIEEKSSKKVSGEYSLFVSFEYNADIVYVIKQFDGISYDSKNHVWEIPILHIKNLIEKLSEYDEINLKLFNHEEEKKQIKYKLSNYKTKPFNYQLDGIQFGLNHDKWLLLDSPGLGKTLQAIYIAQELKNRHNIKHCLIICGVNSLKFNWKNEINKHSDLSSKILGEKINSKGKTIIGSIQDRLNDLKNKINEFFVITNIETLRNGDIVKEIEKGENQFDLIVCDEMHVCKSPTSQQGKNLLKLKSAKYKIGMTGTVLLNSPLDVYVPLKWIDKEKGTMTNFKYLYCSFTGPFNNILCGYKHMDFLKKQLDSCSLRRDKTILDLPDKTVIDEVVEMSAKQEDFYKNIVNGIVSQVDKVNITTTSLLAMVARLRQATACPSILTSENIESAKIDRAVQLCDEIISNNNKIVIFSTFKETLNSLKEKLEKYSPLVCHGDIQEQEINDNIKLFQSDDKHKIMLCTWQKMGTGITLNKASYSIFIDTPWTQGVYEQAQDRIHRIGSKNPVFIYNLITKGTIDERVHQIVSSKKAMTDYIVDDKISNDSIELLKQYIIDLTV